MMSFFPMVHGKQLYKNPLLWVKCFILLSLSLAVGLNDLRGLFQS